MLSVKLQLHLLTFNFCFAIIRQTSNLGKAHVTRDSSALVTFKSVIRY